MNRIFAFIIGAVIGFCFTKLYLLRKKNKSKRYISEEEKRLAEELHKSLINYVNIEELNSDSEIFKGRKINQLKTMNDINVQDPTIPEVNVPAEEKTEEEEKEAVAKETYEAEAGLYIPPEEKKEDEE